MSLFRSWVLVGVLAGLTTLLVGCSGSAAPPGPDANARYVDCGDYLKANAEVRFGIVSGNTQNVFGEGASAVSYVQVDRQCRSQAAISVADAMVQAASAPEAPASTSVSPDASATASPLSDGTPLCRDFLKLSSDDRDQLVSQIAVDRNETRVLNPAWRGNVEMVCGENPGWTVGTVIDSVAGNSESTNQTTIDPETGDEVSSGLPPCDPDDPWFKKLQDVGDGKCELSD